MTQTPYQRACCWVRMTLGSIAAASLLLGGALPLAAQTPEAKSEAEADVIIIAPVIIPPRRSVQPRVRVEFVAQGDEWGSVYLGSRLLFSPRNFNRRQEFQLNEGIYHLRFTGIASSDVWSSGYLTVGRDDIRNLVVVFSKTGGVRVLGDSQAWLSDEAVR